MNKTATLIEQNPVMLPSFIDYEEFKRDFKAREDIEKILLKLDAITKNLTDTKILLDHDNYQDSFGILSLGTLQCQGATRWSSACIQ